MPPRAIWRGAISFGMVSIPVRLYTATENKDVSFRQLAEEDLRPIKQVRWSPTLEREVEYGELVKGYEYAKEQYVVLTDEDLETLPVPSKHTIAISQFVDGGEIDPIHYDKAYYMDPDDAGKKPYALLYHAMWERNLVALGKIALRQKERLVAIRPQEGHLTAEILLYPDEIRPYEGSDVSDLEVNESELEMAFALIDMLHEPFDPERYTDEYREALIAMITAKLEGGEVAVAEEEAEPAQSVDLMAALRASVEAARARGSGEAPAGDAASADEADEEAEADEGAAEPATAKRGSKSKQSTAKSSAKSSSSKSEGKQSEGKQSESEQSKAKAGSGSGGRKRQSSKQ